VTNRAAPSVAFTVRVAAVLALLLPVLWLRLLFTRENGRAFLLVRQCAGAVLRLGGCRVQLLRADLAPRDSNAMVISNHVSLADAAVLLATLPFDFRFVANHVYARYPILGAVIRAASANIVDRESWRSRADSGQAMVDALAAGRSLLVFPEGTTSSEDGMLPFRNGPFRAAARTGCPVLPTVIRGTRELLPPNTYLLSNVPLSIELLPPLTPRDTTRDAVADLRNRARDAISLSLGSRPMPDAASASQAHR
jgi:1-acyl-sn-glycerol-3-phosphate acyltransferase